jgi:excisionase family DNA binding protein
MTPEQHTVTSVVTRPALTLEDLRARTVVSVEEGGAALGLSRSTAYQATRTGELPTLRVGRKLVVPTARLLRLLGDEPSSGAN